ncbi:MAG: ribosome recycling factor [Candidatus Gracilibacteria bacterium]|jgi:ribosome recycling factor|nr:ribosome recycling factor [Candidatus Gracilibacteria bacterium]
MQEIQNAEQSFQKTYEFLKKELSTLQTGRADARLIEDIEVELYGAMQPIKHMGNISIPDSNSILIDPWDKSALVPIEKAIEQNSKVSFGIKNDGVVIRLNVPVLTEERRREVVKVAHSILEKTKIAVRNTRHDVQSKLKKQKDDKEISEDDFFRAEKDLQEKVNDINKKIDELSKKKEQEIMTV